VLDSIINLFPPPGGFELTVKAGEFTDSEIIVMLGENGTGKTTFIRMLAGRLEPDDGGMSNLYIGVWGKHTM
jgi:translation initiation factor RLI1